MHLIYKLLVQKLICLFTIKERVASTVIGNIKISSKKFWCPQTLTFRKELIIFLDTFICPNFE